MNENDVSELSRSIDKVVRFYCTDGEIITARIDLVSTEDMEVVYQMLATNREDKPAYAKTGIGAAYLLRFGDVERFEVEDGSTESPDKT
jgi:hypothetical protein